MYCKDIAQDIFENQCTPNHVARNVLSNWVEFKHANDFDHITTYYSHVMLISNIEIGSQVA